MSCESCTGCFEATPCSAPSPSLHGHISKEYRHFLKAARICDTLLDDPQDIDSASSSSSVSRTKSTTTTSLEEEEEAIVVEKKQAVRQQDRVDHAFNTMIGVLANNQFTAQTYLAMAYKQLGPSAFLQMSRRLAHHGFWGRLLTWAFLFVKEDSEQLRTLLDRQDQDLLQTVNDEAEMFEVFNPAVSCQRVQWNTDPMPSVSSS
ncbi:hypothetical protein BGX29_007769 [Mortierella sp. GBA35]|nr:hypothetical protein BGX29_007769 [Mortierella sp. GBA35]